MLEAAHPRLAVEAGLRVCVCACMRAHVRDAPGLDRISDGLFSHPLFYLSLYPVSPLCLFLSHLCLPPPHPPFPVVSLFSLAPCVLSLCSLLTPLHTLPSLAFHRLAFHGCFPSNPPRFLSFSFPLYPSFPILKSSLLSFAV